MMEQRSNKLPDDLFKDPVLLELLAKARDAFDDLAKYMVLRAAEAGIDLPPEWTELGLKLPPLEDRQRWLSLSVLTAERTYRSLRRYVFIVVVLSIHAPISSRST